MEITNLVMDDLRFLLLEQSYLYGDRFGWRRKSFGEDAVAVQTC